MKKAELKTKKTLKSPIDFIETLDSKTQKEDSLELLKMFSRITGEDPQIWGTSIIGFGDYTYISPKTGRTGDWFKTGFSPRKGKFSLYLSCDIGKFDSELKNLGKYKTGKGCLYFNKLQDIDIKALEKLVKSSLKNLE